MVLCSLVLSSQNPPWPKTSHQCGRFWSGELCSYRPQWWVLFQPLGEWTASKRKENPLNSGGNCTPDAIRSQWTKTAEARAEIHSGSLTMKSKLNRVWAQHKVTFKPRNVCLKAEEAAAFNKRFKGSDERHHHLLKNKNLSCQFGLTAFMLFFDTLKKLNMGHTAMLSSGLMTERYFHFH